MDLTPEQRDAIKAQKENCPFCMIVAGKIPAQKVYEDDIMVAVLDINPARPGHLLLVPKEHYPILPLMPEKDFSHLFNHLGSVAQHLRKAMLANHASAFIANGPAAGQQSQHFLVHLIPSDKPLSNFSLPEKPLEPERVQQVAGMIQHNLPLMLKERAKMFPIEDETADEQVGTGSQEPSELAQLIEGNPAFKKLLMENPEAVIAGLDDNPSLKPLFEGVDVHVLSERLRKAQEETSEMGGSPAAAAAPETAPRTSSPRWGAPEDEPPPVDAVESEGPRPEDLPRATDLSDHQLALFIDSKDKLQKLLLRDPETLREAMREQPRLARFFEGSSIEQVRKRYVEHSHILGGEPGE